MEYNFPYEFNNDLIHELIEEYVDGSIKNTGEYECGELLDSKCYVTLKPIIKKILISNKVSKVDKKKIDTEIINLLTEYPILLKEITECCCGMAVFSPLSCALMSGNTELISGIYWLYENDIWNGLEVDEIITVVGNVEMMHFSGTFISSIIDAYMFDTSGIVAMLEEMCSNYYIIRTWPDMFKEVISLSTKVTPDETYHMFQIAKLKNEFNRVENIINKYEDISEELIKVMEKKKELLYNSIGPVEISYDLIY